MARTSLVGRIAMPARSALSSRVAVLSVGHFRAASSSNLRKQIRKLPKIPKSDSVKIIHYYSFVSLMARSAMPEAEAATALGARLLSGQSFSFRKWKRGTPVCHQ